MHETADHGNSVSIPHRVDSICINQRKTDPAALQERGLQVAMMDEIYSRAVQVNVHLGPSDAASDVAMDTIKGLWQAYSAALLAPGLYASRRYDI